MLERLVSERLNDHLDVINTLPVVQAAYRWYHSTETVLAKVVSDVTMAADDGDVSVLELLDLSAGFDTVDHSILIPRLHVNHHVKGTTPCWFESYLRERYQAVTYSGITAPATMVAQVYTTRIGSWTVTIYYVHR